ncbi:hypothetical protein FKM82_002450 [Ascaphus truei]
MADTVRCISCFSLVHSGRSETALHVCYLNRFHNQNYSLTIWVVCINVFLLFELQYFLIRLPYYLALTLISVVLKSLSPPTYKQVRFSGYLSFSTGL